MKTKLLAVSLLIFCCNTVLSQITTEVFSSKGDVFKRYPELTISDRTRIPQITIPYVDNAELIKESVSIKGKNLPFKFGKSNEVNLSIKDGIWIKTDSKSTWSLIIFSKNAFSLNIILSELFLPKNSNLFLYDADGTMIYGPITSDFNFENEEFLCDIIRGEYLILRIISSNEDVPKVKLGIKNVVHGFRNIFPSLSKSSGSCNNNIECFTDWKIESNAVAWVLLTGGEMLCSGSLINNTSSTFHPYFLTAFHCIDIAGGDPYSQYFQDGTLQQFEIDDVYDMAFRFDYRYTTCVGSTVDSYQTFNHATFKAAWYTSDFALVELNSSSVRTTAGITLLGWDKTGNTPSEGVGIHHPSGDVMKISFDDDNLSETSYLSNSGSYYWRVDWDDGVTEPGSSGSPLLDQNKRIIGQLKGGYSYCESEDMRDWYGCFYRSWTGGGTNTTRLSNWLDPNSTGVNTLNSTMTLTGPDLVCSSGTQYTLVDLPSGSSITWSPSANITRYSAQGSNPCTFVPYEEGDYGTIDASISFDGNQYAVIDKSVWVGKPAPSIVGPDEVECYTPEWYFVDNESMKWGDYLWSTDYNMEILSTTTGYKAEAQGLDEGYGQIFVEVTNDCGSNENRLVVYVSCSKFMLSPNPASEFVTISRTVQNPLGLKKADNYIEPLEYSIQIVDFYGNLHFSGIGSGDSFTVPVSNLKNGNYYVKINDGKEEFNLKLIVKH